MKVEMIEGGFMIYPETEFELDYMDEVCGGRLLAYSEDCEDCGKANTVFVQQYTED